MSPQREHRIAMEIVVDAYGPEERSLGWYYYLEGKLGFPLGVLVPCVLTDHQGGRLAVTFIVRFRRIEGQESCVVVFTWGRARKIEG